MLRSVAPKGQEFRYSSTESFMVCRRKFQYEYVWEIEPNYGTSKKPTNLADVGSAFHKGMEVLYKGEPNPREAVTEWYTENDLDPNGLVKINTSMKNANDVSLGCYDRYVSWLTRSNYDEGMTPILMEATLRWEILPGIFLVAHPDRVDEDEYDQIHVRDYKTVGRYDQLLKYSDRNRQGLTYVVMLEEMLQRTVSTFTLLQVHRNPPKGNPIAVNPITEWFDEEQKQSHRVHLANVVQEMVALAEGNLAVYPHPGDHCDWCPFQDLCLAADADPGRVPAMLKTNYRKKVSE